MFLLCPLCLFPPLLVLFVALPGCFLAFLPIRISSSCCFHSFFFSFFVPFPDLVYFSSQLSLLPSFSTSSSFPRFFSSFLLYYFLLSLLPSFNFFLPVIFSPSPFLSSFSNLIPSSFLRAFNRLMSCFFAIFFFPALLSLKNHRQS
jgi:hypothetical protein